MINLSSLDLNNKNLVIRVDMNVPIKDGNILDSTRIKACLSTIEYALENNAKVLLISHLGRPIEGNFEEEFSLKPVANELSKIINMDVELIDTLESSKIFKSSSNIQVLENIRFFKGEKENSQELGNKLGSLGDIYVFDAFGTAHREQASTHAANLRRDSVLSESDRSGLPPQIQKPPITKQPSAQHPDSTIDQRPSIHRPSSDTSMVGMQQPLSSPSAQHPRTTSNTDPR